VSRKPDSHSPVIARDIAAGMHRASATLELAPPGGTPVATFAFDDVVLTSLDAGSGEGDRQEVVEVAVEPDTGPGLFVYAPAAPPLPLHETQVGEMEVPGITGVIPLYSDSWGLFSAGGGGGGGGGAGAATFSDYEVTKAIDAATDTLLTRMITGVHTPTVDIRLFEPGTQSVG
jgi:Type VI secretion system effector, Hcp